MGSDDDRDRSASPPRESKPKSKAQAGFKWKEKRLREEAPDSRTSGRLERGYRDRSPRRDSYRDNGRDRDERDRRRDRDDDREDSRRRDHSPRRRDGADSYQPRSDGRRPDSGEKLVEPPVAEKTIKPSKEKKERKEKKEKKAKQVTSNEPMIVVNVNDRLGTKAAIPCLASDNIKAFKAMVAAHIGRQPHEIMLKRQGERPFKDQLSLEDYGVSNGVQLDLELDTGD